MVNLMLEELELVAFAKKVTSSPTYTLLGDATKAVSETAMDETSVDSESCDDHEDESAIWLKPRELMRRIARIEIDLECIAIRDRVPSQLATADIHLILKAPPKRRLTTRETELI
jgi:hypothetical protein